MRKKKVLITISVVGILLASFIILSYINNDGVVIASGKSEEYVNNRTFSLMLETSRGSGEYQVSNDTTWPGSGYMYNETLSSCENGSTLIWNNETNTVTLKANISDKCYLYFDIVPPDVTLATTNIAYGATPATLSCSNATASYNKKYQRIEVSQINRANNQTYGNCTLTYQEPSSNNYLNNYIIDLVGTAQGIGQVVDEKYNEPYNYNTVAMSYSSSYITNQNNRYTSTTTTSGTQRDIKFTVASSGYYTFNYSIPTSSATSSSGRNYVYRWNVNTTSGGQYYYSTYNNGATTIGTYDLGYLNVGDYIWVRFYYYDNNPTVWFEMTNTYNTIDTGVRYEGKDPNNYVWFNNELWRIIGVFDENSHEQSGQNLVKIIRNDSIGGLAWHKSNTNDWTASSLMNLLNGAYYNAENGTGGEYCYGYSTTVGANCDYTESGINDTYRPMIENVTWYLGGSSTNSATAEAFYGYERGTTVYSGRPTTTTGYIGLMYPSDYGYSVLASSCARTTNLGSYNNSTCAGQSWMYGQGYEWTITPRSSYSDIVFDVSISGLLDVNSARIGYAARPVLYLDSNVYVIDGTGTQSDPYIIGMG